MTKILYLSMSREEYSPNYFPFLRSYIDEVKSPDTEVDLRGTRVGRIDSFRFFETLDWISILDSVIGAELEGYDAVAIGNILDPALREARSMVDIPVLGLGETSMLTVLHDGQHLLAGRCQSLLRWPLRGERRQVRPPGPAGEHRVHGSHAARAGRLLLRPRQAWRRRSSRSTAAARASLDKGAEVVDPAGGRLTAFLNANGIREVDGAPLLDGTVSLWSLPPRPPIRIRRQSGSFVSRRRLYARAPEASIAAAGAEYADGYHLPALGRLRRHSHPEKD